MNGVDVKKLATGLIWGGLVVVILGAALGALFGGVIVKSPEINAGAIQMTDQVRTGSHLVTHFNWLMFTLWSAPAAAIGLPMLFGGWALFSGAAGRLSSTEPGARPATATPPTPADEV